MKDQDDHKPMTVYTKTLFHILNLSGFQKKTKGIKSCCRQKKILMLHTAYSDFYRQEHEAVSNQYTMPDWTSESSFSLTGIVAISVMMSIWKMAI